jgi:hypothetical protein
MEASLNRYLCKLLPPRKSFIADMTFEEGALMQAHPAIMAKRGFSYHISPMPRGVMLGKAAVRAAAANRRTPATAE